MLDFDEKILQRVRSGIQISPDKSFRIKKFATCQMLNEKFYVSEFESKSQPPEKKLNETVTTCHNFRGKSYNACELLLQKYN